MKEKKKNSFAMDTQDRSLEELKDAAMEMVCKELNVKLEQHDG